MSETLTFPAVSKSMLLEQTESKAAYGWGTVIPTILLLRGIVFAVGVIAVRTVHSLAQVKSGNASGFPWIAFDSHYYRYILLNGYPAGPAVPYQIAFFPLFPLTSRLLLPITSALFDTHTAPLVAMLVCSNLCSLIGLCFVYAWARLLTTPRVAFIATALLACYPGAVFLSAGLTEGPFMMFAAIVLYLLQKQRLYSAAAVSALATACRPTAISVAITVVLWTIYYSWNMPKGRLLGRVLLIGMLSVAGAASYQCYMWHRYQRFDVYKIAEDRWDSENDHTPAAEVLRLKQGIDELWNSGTVVSTSTAYLEDAQAIEMASGHVPTRYSMEFFKSRLTESSAWNRVMALALFMVLIAAAFKASPVSKIVLILPLIIFAISYLPNFGLRASSILRYESAGIPLFVVMAFWLSTPKSKPVLLAVGALSLAVQLYYAFLFSRGYWVG